ncbi:hypothetical protein [Lactobacillus jensenii]|uniref:DUF1828 domain-containing protein n=1 Tax=Lactobacillus jensenii TaxID=109790 RepID=A0ABU9FH79_LACJE|nr:hypothetical protein [Lactobacillus jensenii]DAR66704.1 MAG TPA: hypothetical protein [Caudoviricetes sp.]MCW8072187.1 hypothetical protein [Lactobacillus jensenii]MDK8236067.1 hypothetical protein [Lactobacillus jensenii]MDT9544355.1 hypothetical protein [Lactobacillus jensenii]MDT9586808.1 hypothetical protein [Lactobacillus jensenii]
MLILDTLKSNYNRIVRINVTHSGNAIDYIFNEKDLQKQTKNVRKAVITSFETTENDIYFLANIETTDQVINLKSETTNREGQREALNSLLYQIKIECPELFELIQKSVKGWE